MQRKALIVCTGFILLSGCSVLKKAGIEKNWVNDLNSNQTRLELTKNQNITNSGFYISKAEVEISTKGETEKGICSIKFVPPGKYLISIRNRTGIEAARIFISNDTVLMNDRINRTLYYGSNQQLLVRYGVNQSLMPLILGDYLTEDLKANEPENCTDGLIKKSNILNGSPIKYTIDCRLSKVISAATGNNNSELRLRFSRFTRCDKILAPAEIEIEDFVRMTKILIKIEKIEYPWNGNIEFIPGSKYEQIPLL